MRSERLSPKEMESATGVQILDVTDCNIVNANAVGIGMNLSILSSASSK